MLSLLSVVAFSATAAAQPAPRQTSATLSMEEYSPKSTLVVPEHPVTRAKFPFVDVHSHQSSRTPEQVDQLIEEMDKLNMRIMVNLSGGFGDRLKQNVQAMKSRYKDRFAVFANIDFKGLDEPGYSQRAAAQLEQDIKNGAQGLKIFKNFGMDMKDAKGERIHVDDPRFDAVFEVCGRYKAPVLIHTAEPAVFFQPIDKYNERWLELNQFPRRARPADKYPSWETIMTEQRNLFARHPKTTFINAHMGWLANDLGQLGQLLDKHKNMYVEVAAILAELGRQPRFAREFFTKYQDRVLFGKDIWSPVEYHTYFRVFETADEYLDYYRKRHAFWKMYGMNLPDDVLKKLYYKNALKIIPGLSAAGFPN